MDDEWRQDLCHGMDAGIQVHRRAMGHLLRADDDVPAGHRRARVQHSCVSWDAFSRPTMEFAGYSCIGSPDPLFVHQFSHAWFDFRDQRDQYANYFRIRPSQPGSTSSSACPCAGDFLTTTRTHGASQLQIRVTVIRLGEALLRSAISTVRLSLAPLPGHCPSCPRRRLPASPICMTNMDCVPGKSYGFVDAFNPRSSWTDARCARHRPGHHHDDG